MPRVSARLACPRLTLSLYSPEDHAILEGEYQRNPKPDKDARAAIVSRVSLGEKEVQVRLLTCVLKSVILISRFP